jgi:xanthine dehydrogenase accessory factor
MNNFWSKALSELRAQGACVVVEVVKAEGSTPREKGAKMLVTPCGISSSIGGGTLEWLAMAEAQSLLGKPSVRRTITKSLGPDLGQCCGGRVTLLLESFTQVDDYEIESRASKESREATHLHLWGAGHVGRALAMAMAPLPFEITWWDVRDNAFPSHVPENVTCRLGGARDMQLPGLVLVMTHSHALDFEIVDFSLRNKAFSRVGLIGSETKRSRFLKRLAEAGHGADDIARLTCPIGNKAISSKHPAVIAASVAVQLLEWRELLKTSEIPMASVAHSAKT